MWNSWFHLAKLERFPTIAPFANLNAQAARPYPAFTRHPILAWYSFHYNLCVGHLQEIHTPVITYARLREIR